jgi:ribosome-binding factor A
MSYRRARVSHFVRDVVSDAIANRVWDPRVSRFTSVTRVEVSADLRTANVHVSVMGTEAEATTTMKGLQSARGMIQTRLARRLDMRQCPIIHFYLDRGLKSAIETIRQIDQADGEASRDCAGPEGGANRPSVGAEGGQTEPSSNSGVDQ